MYLIIKPVRVLGKSLALCNVLLGSNKKMAYRSAEKIKRSVMCFQAQRLECNLIIYTPQTR